MYEKCGHSEQEQAEEHAHSAPPAAIGAREKIALKLLLVALKLALGLGDARLLAPPIELAQRVPSERSSAWMRAHIAQSVCRRTDT